MVDDVCLKEIGSGSYATIYSFTDPSNNQKYALKRANDDLNETEIKRFKLEYEVMSKLTSPYVLEVYSFDSTKNEYVMEFMDYNLYDYILNDNPPEDERRYFINEIFQGFQYIHSKNILHRDVHPKNIMIKECDGHKFIKIADFGRVKTSGKTYTPWYIPPHGDYSDPDLKKVGLPNYAIYHETFDLTRLVAFIMTGDPSGDKIDDGKLKEFVKKGLSDDTSKRYQSVNEMISAFRNV